MKKKEQKNVMFVHSGDAWIRGSELVLLQCMLALKESWNVSLVCNQAVLAGRAKSYGFNAFNINLNKFIPFYGDNNPFIYLKTIFDLLKIVKKEKIDIIHMTSAMSAQYCVPVSKITKSYTIAHIQQPDFLTVPLKLSLIALSDYILSVSYSAGRNFLSHKKLHVIYNGVDVEKFKPALKKKYLPEVITPQKKNMFFVGSVGSLIPRKRFDIVVKTASILAKIKPDIIFIIVGAGESESSLKKLSRDLGVDDRIFFLGERNDVNKIIPEFDIFIFPTEAEACPLVAIEAMACGVPVVASGIPCLTEVLDNGQTGITITKEATNPEKYATAILKLYEKSEYRVEMGQAARKKVVINFSEDAFIKNIQEFYNENFN